VKKERSKQKHKPWASKEKALADVGSYCTTEAFAEIFGEAMPSGWDEAWNDDHARQAEQDETAKDIVRMAGQKVPHERISSRCQEFIARLHAKNGGFLSPAAMGPVTRELALSADDCSNSRHGASVTAAAMASGGVPVPNITRNGGEIQFAVWNFEDALVQGASAQSRKPQRAALTNKEIAALAVLVFGPRVLRLGKIYEHKPVATLLQEYVVKSVARVRAETLAMKSIDGSRTVGCPWKYNFGYANGVRERRPGEVLVIPWPLWPVRKSA
jgi:hypothetical protein